MALDRRAKEEWRAGFARGEADRREGALASVAATTARLPDDRRTFSRMLARNVVLRGVRRAEWDRRLRALEGTRPQVG